MSQDIITQLKKLRTEPRAGYVGEEKRVASRDRLMSAITVSGHRAPWTPFVALEFIRFSFSDIVTKPVTAMASFVILALASLTTVSAASQSLPGDTLYGVKLVSERAQLSLTGADKRAVLHTEFAERRFQEIVELSSAQEPNQILVANAVHAFKREVAYATQEIQNLQNSSTTSLLNQVSVVTDRFDALNSVVADTSFAQTPDISTDIKQTTSTATNQVVDAIVGAHEVEPQPTSGIELRKLFQTRMNKIIQRRTFSLGRIEVIETHASFTKISSRSEMATLRRRVDALTDPMSEASNLVAAGGYRSAFDNLREVESILDQIESDISAVEFKLIEIMTSTTSTNIDIPMLPEDAPESGVQEEELEERSADTADVTEAS